jgi:hypothetical protein
MGFKFKYELHYWETDITGNSEHDLEFVTLEAIFFAKDGIRGDKKYRLALGLDCIVDGLLGLCCDKPYDWGIGTGLRFKY